MKTKLNPNWYKDPEERPEKLRCLDIHQLANESNFWLKIHSSILYGLLTGPLPDFENNMRLLEKCKKLGAVPDENYISPLFLTK